MCAHKFNIYTASWAYCMNYFDCESIIILHDFSSSCWNRIDCALWIPTISARCCCRNQRNFSWANRCILDGTSNVSAVWWHWHRLQCDKPPCTNCVQRDSQEPKPSDPNNYSNTHEIFSNRWRKLIQLTNSWRHFILSLYSDILQYNNTSNGRFKVLRGLKNVHDAVKVIEVDGKPEMDVW